MRGGMVTLPGEHATVSMSPDISDHLRSLSFDPFGKRCSSYARLLVRCTLSIYEHWKGV